MQHLIRLRLYLHVSVFILVPECSVWSRIKICCDVLALLSSVLMGGQDTKAVISCHLWFLIAPQKWVLK